MEQENQTAGAASGIKKKEAQRADLAEEASAAPKTEKPREKKLRFSYKEQKEWDTIEDDIAACEEQIADLEKQIEASATDYGKLNKLMEEKTRTETLLEEKMDRWMYLNELAEKIAAAK